MSLNKWFNRRAVLAFTLLIVMGVLLAACGGGDKTGTSATDAGSSKASTTSSSTADVARGTEGDGSPTVTLANFAFGPNEIRVKAGTTVTFVNEDQIAHDVVQAAPDTINSKEPSFSSPQILPGSSWSYTFKDPGTYPLLCTVGSHYLLGMTAEIIVE